ncbi:MAG: hypothetical protein ACOX8A_10125 [Thermacetogeniaceae bacterium]
MELFAVIVFYLNSVTVFAIIVYFFRECQVDPVFGLIVMDRAKNNDFNSGIKIPKGCW